MEESWISDSEEETLNLGETVGRQCCGGEVLSLEGSLGMGKTVFAKGVARGLEVPVEAVTSPSFTILREHEGRLRFVHVDLYRIEKPEETRQLGLEDVLFCENAVAVVEWGEKLKGFIGKPTHRIRFEDLGGSK